MAPSIEASSLSDITQIASNPPKYPRNPTDRKRGPLTLYIARVPGSRDVILTTLKPQPKNVTAEIVTSSLYYLHLDSEDDARLLEDDVTDLPEEDEPRMLVQEPVHRKPLPESASVSLDLNRQHYSEPAIQDPSSKLNQKPENTPFMPSNLLTGPVKPPLDIKQVVPRRPLGPRTLLSEPIIGRKPLLAGSKNQPLSSNVLPLRTSMESTGSSESNHSNSENSKTRTTSTKAFSITVIRRDPSTGAQWNIGTVSGWPAPPDGDRQGRRPVSPSRKTPFDMLINITAPGYTYFRSSLATGPFGNAGTTLGQQSVGQNAPIAGNDEFTNQSKQSVVSSSSFERQVRMEGGLSFWDRASKQHKRTKSDVTGIHSIQHRRSNTGDLTIDAPNLMPASHDTKVPSESGAKGYVFTSPWGGRCKFTTGSAGRSLRCKHSVPGPVSANVSVTSASFEQNAVVISELRFNLPSPPVFNTSSTGTARSTGSMRFKNQKIDNFRHKLSPHKPPPPLPPRSTLPSTSYAAMYPSDVDVPPLPPRPDETPEIAESSDEDEPSSMSPHLHSFLHPTAHDSEARLDLSLGREKAGGGNRGKRAKLGKLIVYDEGFKMMDLVVAANMGVWWSVWEADHR